MKWKLLLCLTSILPLSGLQSFAQDSGPDRRVVMAFEYPGVEVLPGQSVSLNLLFQNKGKSEESLEVSVLEKPIGWSAALKSGELTVTGLFLSVGESRPLTFQAEPPLEQRPGKYLFRVRAQSEDGGIVREQSLLVTVRERKDLARGTAGIGLATSYPVLRGSAEVFYEFSLELENKMDQDAVFDLFSKGPEGWEVNFKPAYESRYISSFQLKAKKSAKLTVEVKPPFDSKPGEYPVNVRISSGAVFAETTLTVVLTGTYDLSVSTASGLLSLEAMQGKPARVSIYVKNLGTAVQSHIGLLSFNPENWIVEYRPDRLDDLPPGETRQVEVMITPYNKALVGDYSVELRASGEKVAKSVELRVTVKASSIFGWIGIALIVLVVAGLAFLFRWLGRR
jgi:uncharacterized membrane protein